MAITRKIDLNSIFIFLFFAIFPFGQIIRIGILQPIDLVVGLAAIYTIFKKLPKPEAFKYFENFLILTIFSWVFGTLMFQRIEVFYGFLYLIRITAYLYFVVYVWNFAKKNLKNSKLLVNSLLMVSVISAIFGWMQFFWFSDLKPFFVWGWDMHLFRLVGTFLDPTFLGLIIVFGLLTTLIRINEMKKKKNYILIAIFLLISLAFTYSRASYLALFAGLFVIAWHFHFIKKVLIFILIFVGLLFLLPTSKNHSIEILRSFSAIARVENYQTTLHIFSKSPIFGVGYDNMCLAYQKFVGFQPFNSHACSGSDSSLLFILATTGLAGFIVFVFTISRLATNLVSNSHFLILTSTFTALFVHSLFSNSMFYPWIMGYVLIVLTVSLGGKVKS